MCSQSNRTLLYCAAWKGRLALIDPLVGLGAVVNAKTSVSEDPAAAPPTDSYHHPLLPTRSIPTPTPPLAPVSPRAPLHPHNFPSMDTSTLLSTHLALTHCLVLLYR